MSKIISSLQLCNSILWIVLCKLFLRTCFTTTFFVNNISYLEPVKNPQQVADVYLAMFVCTLVFLAAITLLAIFYAFRYLNPQSFMPCLWESTKFQAMFVGFLSSKPPCHFLRLQVFNSIKYHTMFVEAQSFRPCL